MNNIASETIQKVKGNGHIEVKKINKGKYPARPPKANFNPLGMYRSFGGSPLVLDIFLSWYVTYLKLDRLHLESSYLDVTHCNQIDYNLRVKIKIYANSKNRNVKCQLSVKKEPIYFDKWRL